MDAVATVHGKGNNLSVSYGNDGEVWVEFYFNKIAEKDYIKMRYPGDTKTEIDRAVKQQDKERFATKWDLYQRQLSQYGSDTMLEKAGFLSPGEIEICHKAGIRTAKELSQITDNFIATLGPGGRKMMERAQRFVQSEASEAKEKQLLDENYKLNNRIAAMAAQLEQMEKRLASMDAPAPAKRGRKPKVKPDDTASDNSASD